MVAFKMPSLGADMESGTLVEWLVSAGDRVRRGEPIAVVDTDKAAIEIESFHDGVLETFLVEPGERVAVGAPLATIEADGGEPLLTEVERAEPHEAAPAAEPVAPRPTSAEQRPAAATAALVSPPVRHHAAQLGVDLARLVGTGAHGRITRQDVDRASAAERSRPTVAGRVSPYARRLAEELGVDLREVVGTGAGGAVRAEDVRTRAAQQPGPGPVSPTPAPTVAAPPGGPRRPVPSRATIAALMGRSKREIPHYYVATTVDLHAVTEWLRRHNHDVPVTERIVPAAALFKATALAARSMQDLNGFWVDDRFVPGEDVHLGVAISVRGGALVAPALLGAADLDVATLMQRLRDLVTRARRGRLTRAELTSPTMTVTDLGDQGVEEVIGVIYPPQVALVGIGRVVERPWAVDGMLTVRPVVRFALSGDHRATDGYTGARFLAAIDELLQKPEEL